MPRRKSSCMSTMVTALRKKEMAREVKDTQNTHETMMRKAVTVPLLPSRYTVVSVL